MSSWLQAAGPSVQLQASPTVAREGSTEGSRKLPGRFAACKAAHSMCGGVAASWAWPAHCSTYSTCYTAHSHMTLACAVMQQSKSPPHTHTCVVCN